MQRVGCLLKARSFLSFGTQRLCFVSSNVPHRSISILSAHKNWTSFSKSQTSCSSLWSSNWLKKNYSIYEVDLEPMDLIYPETPFKKFCVEFYEGDDLIDVVDYFETFKKTINEPKAYIMMIERTAANGRHDLMKKYFNEMISEFKSLDNEHYSKVLEIAWRMDNVDFALQILDAIPNPTPEHFSLIVRIIGGTNNSKAAVNFFEKFKKMEAFSNPGNLFNLIELLYQQQTIEATKQIKEMLTKLEDEKPSLIQSEFYDRALMAIAHTENVGELLSYWELMKKRGRVASESYLAFAQSLIVLKSKNELKEFLTEIEAGLDSIQPSGYLGLKTKKQITQLKNELHEMLD